MRAHYGEQMRKFETLFQRLLKNDLVGEVCSNPSVYMKFEFEE